jgi:hypothetical protein
VDEDEKSAGGIEDEATVKRRREKGRKQEKERRWTWRGENDENDETEETARVKTLEASSMDDGSEEVTGEDEEENRKM